MNREEIAEKIKELLSDQLGIEGEIMEDASISSDFNADSLDAVEIIMETEDLFDISVQDEEAEKAITVKGLIDLVENKLKEE